MRKIFQIATGVIAAITIGMVTAQAEEPRMASAGETGGLGVRDSLVVTAQRRAGTVQTTSAALSAYSEQDLQEKTLQSIESLGQLTPGVHISMYQGDASVFIRGIGTPIIVAGVDSSSALHVDGVYLSRPSAIQPAFFDIQRVEVLRGPQGTLYGRNATGGSINVITGAPTDEFEAQARLTFGNYDRYQLFGAVSGPIIEDRVKARLAVQLENRDGYTDITRPGDTEPSLDVEDKDDIAARLKLAFEITDNLELTLTGDYYHAGDRANVFQFVSLGYGDFVPGFNDAFPIVGPYFFSVAAGRQSAPLSRDVFSDAEFFNDTDIWGVSAKFDWDVGGYTISSLTAYRETNPRFQNEIDLTDAPVTTILREEDHWQLSQELQVSSPADGRFKWVLGAYFFEERNKIRNEIFGSFWPLILELPPIPTCCRLDLSGEAETTALAIFGDASYEILDGLSLILGGRYSYEKRDGVQLFQLADGLPFDPALLAPQGLYNVTDLDAESWDAFTPKFGLEYQLSEAAFFYFTVSRGFKSGGFNIGSPQNNPIDPEFIWSYEIGAKLDLFDGRLRVNTAAFYYDYKDLQAQDSVANNTIIRNTGSATITGVEIEFQAAVTEALLIDGAFSWLDAKFNNLEITEPNFPGTPVVNLDGNRLPRAPEFKIALGVQYTLPVGNIGDLTLRADYQWQDETFFTVFNIPTARQKSFSWLKARATLADQDGQWQLALFADNITNEQVLTNAILTGQAYGSIVIGNLAPPRTYGVEASFSF